jgi:hypothetical protein
MRARFLAVVLAIAPVATAHAQQGADLSVGIRAGTLGIGAEVNKLITGHFGVRASINTFSASTTQSQSDIDFDAHIKLKAFTGLVDIYPSNRGSFHLTGGVITNPVSIDASGVPTGNGTYDINGTTYTAAQVGTLSGHGDYPKASPYAGLGWGTPAAKHFGLKFVFDLGAAIGKPTITLSSSNSNAQLQSDLAAQQAKTQTDVEKYAKVYPVLSFGLVARF